MSDYMHDYNGGALATALAMAHQPIWAASSAANYLICAARQAALTPADRKKIGELAAEMEITAKALRAAAAAPIAKPVLLEAAE
jgi:hypothetical protein